MHKKNIDTSIHCRNGREASKRWTPKEAQANTQKKGSLGLGTCLEVRKKVRPHAIQCNAISLRFQI